MNITKDIASTTLKSSTEKPQSPHAAIISANVSIPATADSWSPFFEAQMSGVGSAAHGKAFWGTLAAPAPNGVRHHFGQASCPPLAVCADGALFHPGRCALAERFPIFRIRSVAVSSGGRKFEIRRRFFLQKFQPFCTVQGCPGPVLLHSTSIPVPKGVHTCFLAGHRSAVPGFSKALGEFFSAALGEQKKRSELLCPRFPFAQRASANFQCTCENINQY